MEPTTKFYEKLQGIGELNDISNAFQISVELKIDEKQWNQF